MSIKKAWRSWSVASKIILIFLCALVPVNVLLIYSTQSYMAALRFQMINSGRNVMELAMLRLDNQMDTMELYLYTQSTEDSDFIRVSMDEGDDFFLVSLHSVYRDFSNNLAVNSISGFYYLMAEESQQTVVAFSNDQSENRETVQAFLAQREESFGPSVWKLVEIGERQYLFRECVEESVRYGSAIDVSGFLEQINANVRFDDSAVALLGWDELPQGFDLRQMTLEQNGTLYVYARSDNAPVVVELQVDQDTIYYSLPIVNRVAFVFSFACLLLVPFLYILFHRMILRPLGVLDRAFRAIESGQADYRITQKLSSREFSHMAHSFNAMAQQITHLKIESYERELEKSKILMRNIQLQVRPHFMLNLFHLIYSMAQIQNYKGIQEMTLYLSKYFRKLFSKGDVHTLAEECELVSGYFKVLYTQYPDCFGFTQELDESVKEVKIPTFLLHSIMENVGKYAVSVGNYIDITLRSYPQGGMAVLEVVDDGPGIPPDILEQIQRQVPVEKKDGRHIGIWNARKRLKLLCGEEAELLVESRFSEGTKYTVLLPRNSERGNGK